MNMVNNQGNVWNIDCLRPLREICKLTNVDVVSFQPLTLLAMEEPSNIDRGL